MDFKPKLVIHAEGICLIREPPEFGTQDSFLCEKVVPNFRYRVPAAPFSSLIFYCAGPLLSADVHHAHPSGTARLVPAAAAHRVRPVRGW